MSRARLGTATRRGRGSDGSRGARRTRYRLASRVLGPLAGLALLAAAALVPGARAQDRRDETGDCQLGGTQRLVAHVYTRSDDGRVFCALWRGPVGYPTRRDRNVGETLDRTIVNRTAQCVFDGLVPGEYALAAFHDENANNDLDRNLFGIPSEGTGASNDAFNMFGPPSYDEARFLVPDTPLHQIVVNIHY